VVSGSSMMNFAIVFAPLPYRAFVVCFLCQ